MSHVERLSRSVQGIRRQRVESTHNSHNCWISQKIGLWVATWITRPNGSSFLTYLFSASNILPHLRFHAISGQIAPPPNSQTPRSTTPSQPPTSTAHRPLWPAAAGAGARWRTHGARRVDGEAWRGASGSIGTAGANKSVWIRTSAPNVANRPFIG